MQRIDYSECLRLFEKVKTTIPNNYYKIQEQVDLMSTKLIPANKDNLDLLETVADQMDIILELFADAHNQWPEWRDFSNKFSKYMIAEDELRSPLSLLNMGKFCNYCHQITEKVTKCPRCQRIYYCSGNCRKNDWKIHKKDCR